MMIRIDKGTAKMVKDLKLTQLETYDEILLRLMKATQLETYDEMVERLDKET